MTQEKVDELWPFWKFENVILQNIDKNSVMWTRFKEWLEQESVSILTDIPPGQLDAMERLVNDKEKS